MNREETIKRLRHIQGSDFFGHTANLLESDGKALEERNRIEGQAHALFTQPLSNGQTFAHEPSQCNPLGFVTVLREALEQALSGRKLSNPFILLDDGKPK